jgi:HD-GYP domain-containing protein (c-di-GMP phosphodiesterase class II)
MRPTASSHSFTDPVDFLRGRDIVPVIPDRFERGALATDRIPDSRSRSTRSANTTEISASRLHELSVRMGIPLAAFDPKSGRIVAVTDPLVPPFIPAELERAVRGPKSDRADALVLEDRGGLTLFAFPLDDAHLAGVHACGYVVDPLQGTPGCFDRLVDTERFGADHRLELDRRVPRCDSRLLTALVRMARFGDEMNRAAAATDEDFDALYELSAGNAEEIHLLHCLMENMQVSRTYRDLAEIALGRLSAALPAEQHSILLFDAEQPGGFLSTGAVLDPSAIARLLSRCGDQARTRPLVKNNLEGTLLGADFPGLREFCLAPIAEGERTFGWLLSINIADQEGGTFTLPHTRLLSSVARVLAVHGCNVDLCRGHDDLLLSFVRSLVSSLDAKDPYTRGHSERVALIGRRLGEHLGLPAEDLRDIYLSGLLHDIGKIGVDNEILRKPGALTADEFEQIKKHPVIGFNILTGLRNLRPVLPGVRSHHESWNGKGYPDGLAGESIPLMARILAVADSYDAMGSDRPYRKGLALDKVEDVLRKGAGVQWDPALVATYFACRDDIARLCKEYTPTTSGVLRQSVTDDDFLNQSEEDSNDSLRGVLASISGLSTRAG